MRNVVVLGSLIMDLVARAERLPVAGESLIGTDFGTFLGGKGINQATAAARLGADVMLIGRVGTDIFGDAFFPVLNYEGIESKFVERDPQRSSGVAVILIAEGSGQNAIVVSPNANLAVPASTVELALQSAAQAVTDGEVPIFLCQCETSALSYQIGLQRAHELGMLTILNAAPIPRDPLPDELFTHVDILIVNEVEASVLSGISVTDEQSARTASERLLTKGPEHIIITMGAQGALWTAHTDNIAQHQWLPAFQVQAVDSTAAGDAFCGALVACLAGGKPMEKALHCATAAGAIAATRQGAIASLPTAQEVEHLLAQSNH
jgi:ribokinase